MKILCLGDTHGRYDRYDPAAFPPCDLMLFAGDITARTVREVRDFDRWLGALPVERILLTPGNHDGAFETDPPEAAPDLEHGRCLLHETASTGGLTLFGSPYQPVFMNFAFNRPRGEPLRTLWDDIPPDTDVLLTHTPPGGVLDRPSRPGVDGVGCDALRERLEGLDVTLHVFGHIHECYGVEVRDGTTFVNAAAYSRHRSRMRPPLLVEYDQERGVKAVSEIQGGVREK